MRNERHETVADIVAKIRSVAYIQTAESPSSVLQFADRIEEAAKREREATREDSSQVGNAAAMREACANIAEYAKTAACHTEDAHLLGYLNQIERWAEAALSAPPRNCDIGTAYEQAKRFRSFCKKFQSDIQGMCSHLCQCIDCSDKCHCMTKWSQMPYEEGGAE